MHAANVRSAERFLEAGPSAEEARVQMLFDPQTSGGLLIALPAGRAQALCDALHQADYVEAGIVGEVTALPSGSNALVRAN
jgi:selenide,water dikinase